MIWEILISIVATLIINTLLLYFIMWKKFRNFIDEHQDTHFSKKSVITRDFLREKSDEKLSKESE